MNKHECEHCKNPIEGDVLPAQEAIKNGGAVACMTMEGPSVVYCSMVCVVASGSQGPSEVRL